MFYFISDVHLGVLARKEDILRENVLLEFLSKIKDSCEALYIVGDLFDYWFEYKTVIPKYFYRTLTVLRDFRDNGIEVIYLMGNHDFGHKNFFRDELGINIYTEDIERTIAGKKFYLSHGDGKAYKDTGYLILKKILRNPISQWLYTKLHPDFGIWLASSSSRKSREYTESKDYGKKDGLEDFAAKKIEEGADYVIMGHRHIPLVKNIGNGYYINLGEWIKKPTYGRFDGEKFWMENV